jgi:hypothetical protein
MVHIHSIAASSHPSRQERESDGEATSRSRAGRGGCSAATARVDAAQHQRSSNAAAVPPTTTVEATMHAVHQLLNNPPPSGASLSAMEQWRHDVDQLVITTINTPPPGGITNYQSGTRAHLKRHGHRMTHPHRVPHRRRGHHQWREHRQLHVRSLDRGCWFQASQQVTFTMSSAIMKGKTVVSP